jgi:ferredoxin-type protein NapH
VSFLKKIRDFFSSPKAKKKRRDELSEKVREISHFELKSHEEGCKSCTSCADKQKRLKLDSRHAILGGSLISAAIFGFPVFCLICPIGLSFATVMLLWRAFSLGDATIGIVLVPALLIVEVVFLRKWCGRFCPLSALMNLVARFSKTCLPTIDESKCIESTTEKPCSTCAIVCEAGINLRHPEYGEHTLADCTRCNNCVDNCPAKAIRIPFLPARSTKNKIKPLLVEAEKTKEKHE